MRTARRLSVLLVLCLLAAPVVAQEADYGETEFANSGAEVAQEPFLRGLLMLHSFEYDDARAAFQRAQEADPDFAMAHWGEAMTHNHPIWMEQDREAALEALHDLASTPEARLEKAPTEREKDYFRTLHTLYGAGDDEPKSKEDRDDAYAEAMDALAAEYPDDLDAQAFHALSILGTAHEGRDFSTYMRAAAVVEEVFDENPEHPGAAHYLIHAYDDPVHAPLGLRAARVYADVAPAATHALHMPSHIFFAMGMWEKGAASNVDSYEAAKAQAAERGAPLPGGGFHALHWLHYARLQQGRYDDARSVLSTTQSHARDATTGYASYMQWYMPVAYVVETQQWDQLDTLLDEMSVEVKTLGSRGAVTVHVGRGLAALHQDDLSPAQTALKKAQSALDESDSEALHIQVYGLEGLVALKNDDPDRALDRLKEAAALEADRSLDYGPTFPPKPAHELYGEALLALDRPDEALSQFEATLERYPDRALALQGVFEAARQAGKLDVAEKARTQLSEQWTNADVPIDDRFPSLSNGAPSPLRNPNKYVPSDSSPHSASTRLLQVETAIQSRAQ